MSIKAFPLNQQEYSYNAQDVMKYYAGRNSGVFETGENLKVSANGGLEIRVNSGMGWLSRDYVASVAFWNESVDYLMVDAGHDTYDRIDLVVVSWNFVQQEQNPKLIIRKGTPASSPAVPSLVNDSSTIEIALARINVGKGDIELSDSDIVDLRGNDTYCPMVYDEQTIREAFRKCVGYADGVNKISDFPNVTPASSDKILIEQGGEGKSAYISNLPISDPTKTYTDTLINNEVSRATTKENSLQSELAVERARIDSLSKLSEGSTTGDAELIDIRIGADGVTYRNAGDAVRTQISNLKGDLTNIDDLEKERKIPFISAYSKSLSTTNYISIVLPSSILQNNKLLSFDVYCEDDVRPYLMMYDCDMSLVGNNRLTKRIGSQTYTDVKTGNWYHYENNGYPLDSLPSKEKIALVFNLVPNDSVKRIIEGYICNIKLDNNICDTKIEDVFLYSASPTAEDKVNLYNVGLIEYISNIDKINELEKGNFDCKKLGNGKILCIGDSLTAGVYSNETTPREENYPYFMKRIISNESINAGFPGYSTSMIWNQNKLQSVDFTDVKHIIIMLGTNGGLTDTLETDVYAYDDYHDYATTKTGCYCKIIEYCMEQAPTAHIYLCTTPFFDKIRQPNFAPPTTPDANIVIPKIAEFYGLRVFDVRNGLGVNSKNTNTIQLDGLHGQKEFYERLGTFIGSQLRANASWVE